MQTPSKESALLVKEEDFKTVMKAKKILSCFVLSKCMELIKIMDAKGAAMTVTELMIVTRYEQSTLSANLSDLRKIGIVYTKREGKNVLYWLNEPAVTDLLELCKKLVAETKPTKTI